MPRARWKMFRRSHAGVMEEEVEDGVEEEAGDGGWRKGWRKMRGMWWRMVRRRRYGGVGVEEEVEDEVEDARMLEDVLDEVEDGIDGAVEEWRRE
eukprot:4648586-Pyramimonas_sp.AAC.1